MMTEIKSILLFEQREGQGQGTIRWKINLKSSANLNGGKGGKLIIIYATSRCDIRDRIWNIMCNIQVVQHNT